MAVCRTHLEGSSIKDLMVLYADIGAVLVGRNVCRTANNPVGDIGEYLFAQCCGWKLENNSKAGYDALCPERGRVQIKSRFLRNARTSRQAGDIRDLKQQKFDWLAGVVFAPDCSIDLAFLAPYEAVCGRANANGNNSCRVFLDHKWLETERVHDLTARMAKTWNKVNA